MEKKTLEKNFPHQLVVWEADSEEVLIGSEIEPVELLHEEGTPEQGVFVERWLHLVRQRGQYVLVESSVELTGLFEGVSGNRYSNWEAYKLPKTLDIDRAYSEE